VSSVVYYRDARWPFLFGVGPHAGDAMPLTTAHAVTISGLSSATSYYYAIASLHSAVESTFTTAPGPDASFKALVFGDSGDGSEWQLSLAKRMEQEKFDLVIHTGDVVYPKGDEEDYDAKFFAPYREILRSHPIFPAVGNHDLRHSKNGLGEGYRNTFLTFANNPEHSPFYYSFEWGNTKFVSIESDRLFKKPGPHLQWLEAELASNTRRWLVVFMHVCPYSPGQHGDMPELQATIQPILEKYHVNLVLAGHDHLYERSGPVHGWPYIVTGGGGAGLYEVRKTHPATIKAESCHHYVVLDFENDAIKGKATRRDGTTLDEFEIK
jgi:3',5'-cyclic AMP phosphodiesterase CpdA